MRCILGVFFNGERGGSERGAEEKGGEGPSNWGLWIPHGRRGRKGEGQAGELGLGCSCTFSLLTVTGEYTNHSLPCMVGYLKADERNRLKSIVSKTIRYGFLPHSFCTFDELRDNPNHVIVLHRLLSQPKRTDYSLRQRTHNLTLPTDGNPVIKQNFVYRMVFKDIY